MTALARTSRSARELDQFYTATPIAAALIDNLPDHLGGVALSGFRWLEPSCGTGAFLNLLPDGSIGVDLEPKCPGAVQGDFLTWDLPTTDDPRPLAVLGNPPFKHDVAFFNRCASLGAAFVAFIVPRSWEKASVQNTLDRRFHLVHEEVLPLDAFVFEGAPKAVPTVFQVWEKRDELRPLIVLPTTHADFAFVPAAQRETADFAIQRIGVNAGAVKDLDAEHLSENSHRFVRAIDRSRVAEVRAVFESVDWAPVKARVAGNPSIANGEIVQAYTEAVHHRWIDVWAAEWFAQDEQDAKVEAVRSAQPFALSFEDGCDVAAVYAHIAELQAASGLDAEGRATGGVVYTPPRVARTLVDLARLQPTETVVEPAAGRGMLVAALIEHWLDQGWTHEQIALWGEERLFVGDLDGLALQDLAGWWRGFFAAHGVVSELRNLRAGDALFEGWSDRTFDVTLANPPYVGLQHLPKDHAQRVRSTFKTCAKGRGDLYRAFLERAQTQSQRSVMIVPNAWMRTTAGTALRELLRNRVRAVIDFESRRVFLGPQGASVLTAIVSTGPATQAPVLFRTDMPHESSTPWTVAFRQSDAALGPKAWALAPAVPGDEVSPDAETLGDIAEIHIGIATNCNPAYELVTGTVDGDELVTHDEVQGRDVRLPLGQAPLYLKGTTVKDRTDLRTAHRMLCPYGEDFEVVPEHGLTPDVRAWFEARRGTLLARDKGDVAQYEAWYAFGRRQGLMAFRPDERLFLVPSMAKGPLAPVEFMPCEVGGRFLWTSGYVVRPKDRSPEGYDRLRAVLESPGTWRFLARRGKMWTGGHRSFTPKLFASVPTGNLKAPVAVTVTAGSHVADDLVV
ncbi:N-6 DNA Methylase [Paraburkholderia phenazinium]|uniref:site-specific DNA-methyltransferase (adenine-specific) n=1 Tax=Paraburkholderia phenazinium TaxID=60549 RepID=A0A1G7YEY3_9BURK|nr:N-6 DNA methylase [Paraburkholderia phenazinium]SDG95091.1 N-6 DNA Methylase [Paraburkholderia phenazinium]